MSAQTQLTESFCRPSVNDARLAGFISTTTMVHSKEKRVDRRCAFCPGIGPACMCPALTLPATHSSGATKSTRLPWTRSA
eukprot:5255413-Pleurochrysis_carterae.AAC.2